ncbi:MAG TPA: DUF58 domain-containing protein [Novosphingobium sp.]|nr:DUF58 domain-containing protein [Novosphingobium sp.]
MALRALFPSRPSRPGRPALLPTARAVLLLALLAPAALLLAAVRADLWQLAPALGLAMGLLVLADAALAAGASADWRIDMAGEAEVGGALPIALDVAGGGPAGGIAAALAVGPLLAPGGVLRLALRRDGSGRARGQALCHPARRGLAEVESLALRRTGPLGLGACQRRWPVARALRILPSLAVVRSPALATYLKDARAGEIARRLRGEGSQFETMAEFQPGMDRRRIDWKVSARHGRLMAREYEAERNNQIVFAFDCGGAMCEDLGRLTRLDRAIAAALAAGWVALREGDRVGLFGFAAQVELATPLYGQGGFARLRAAAAELAYRAEEPNFTLALASLVAHLRRRSLVVVFSDFTDPTSATMMVESIGRLLARHRVLFVTLEDAGLEEMARGAPVDLGALARAVGAQGLLDERARVLARLRQAGVEVLEAPAGQLDMRLIDTYLGLRARGGVA